MKVTVTGCMKCGIPPLKLRCSECEHKPDTPECIKFYKSNRMNAFTYNNW
jgi:hypothetical protein